MSALAQANNTAWIIARHEDACQCGQKVERNDQARFDFGQGRYVACGHCSPQSAPQLGEPIQLHPRSTVESAPAPKLETDQRADTRQAAASNPLKELAQALGRFADANGCAERIDEMLLSVVKIAAK